jgi:hypothetical protein
MLEKPADAFRDAADGLASVGNQGSRLSMSGELRLYNAPSLANPARRHETGFDGIFPRPPVRSGSA